MYKYLIVYHEALAIFTYTVVFQVSCHAYRQWVGGKKYNNKKNTYFTWCVKLKKSWYQLKFV